LELTLITVVAVMTTRQPGKVRVAAAPARVFMALVAAHYETKPLPKMASDAEEGWSLERAALEWLEGQALRK